MAITSSFSQPRPRPASFTMSNRKVFPYSTAVVAVAVVVGTLTMTVGLSDSASVGISSSNHPTITATATNIGNNDYSDLESLASSKILMDHTSSSAYSTSTARAALKMMGAFDNNNSNNKENYDDESARSGRNVVQAQKGKENNAKLQKEESGTAGTSSAGTGSTYSSSQIKKFSTAKSQIIYSSGKKNERDSYEMSSPLHVARCRATCLQRVRSRLKEENFDSIHSTL